MAGCRRGEAGRKVRRGKAKAEGFAGRGRRWRWRWRWRGRVWRWHLGPCDVQRSLTITHAHACRRGGSLRTGLGLLRRSQLRLPRSLLPPIRRWRRPEVKERLGRRCGDNRGGSGSCCGGGGGGGGGGDCGLVDLHAVTRLRLRLRLYHHHHLRHVLLHCRHHDRLHKRGFDGEGAGEGGHHPLTRPRPPRRAALRPPAASARL